MNMSFNTHAYIALRLFATSCCLSAQNQNGAGITLRDCFSESFNTASCTREVAELLRQYPTFAAPNSVVEGLVSALRNLAYTSVTAGACQ